MINSFSSPNEPYVVEVVNPDYFVETLTSILIEEKKLSRGSKKSAEHHYFFKVSTVGAIVEKSVICIYIVPSPFDGFPFLAPIFHIDSSYSIFSFFFARKEEMLVISSIIQASFFLVVLMKEILLFFA